jgi:protein-disulfide isomerase
MKTTCYVAAFVGLAIALISIPHRAFAQTASPSLAGLAQPSDDIKALIKEIQELKAGQQAMQKDITEIKERIMPKGQPPFKEADINIEGDPAIGDKDAKVTLIEFADYQCPYCGHAFQQIYTSIVAEYVKTGKVKYVFHDFPLEFHSNAFKASEAARCAGDQGKYWEMHDKLFQNQRTLDPKGLADAAQAVGLDATKFQQCLDTGKYQAQIRSSIEAAMKIGVRGTPSFLLGLSGPDATKFKATKRLGGATAYASFETAIDSLLSPPAEEPKEKAVEKPTEKPGGGTR